MDRVSAVWKTILKYLRGSRAKVSVSVTFRSDGSGDVCVISEAQLSILEETDTSEDSSPARVLDYMFCKRAVNIYSSNSIHC